MSSPKSPALEELHRLTGAPHDQLSNILDGKAYRECVKTLDKDDRDLAWLSDYLDGVRRHVVFPHSLLK